MKLNYISVKNASRNMLYYFQYASSSLFMLSAYEDKQSAQSWTNSGYGQHGTSYIRSMMNERSITLKFYVNTKSNSDVYSIMNSLFNPIDGTLEVGVSTYPDYVYTGEPTVRYIDVYVAEPPAQVSQHGGLIEFSVRLNAPFPFYRDAQSSAVTFSNAYGGFIFSTQFDETDGKIFGMDGHTAQIYNKGDIPAPVRIYIANANMSNPQVILQDGSYIGLTKQISAGETIEITTSYGNKNITINGFDNNRYLMAGSTWIQLPVGTSLVSAYTASGSPTITMYWENYYSCYGS